MNKIASRVLGAIFRKDGQSHTAFDAETMDFNDLMIERARQDQIDVVQVDVYYNLTLRENKYARYYEGMRRFYEAMTADVDFVTFYQSDEMRWGASAVMESVETSDVLEQLFRHIAIGTKHYASVGDVFVIRSRDWGFFCGAFLCTDFGWEKLPGRHIDIAMPNIIR